ncbi:siderophore-interacting protein [Kribbella sp. NBC_01505]|uniref:siderophore-interacting protein n=1 Tax=Kribbella sp. NBC_01505 TaxID=2903580 RepID=UPI003870A0F1
MNREKPRERVEEHHLSGTGISRIGYPIGIRQTTVASTRYLTPQMLRVTLEGPELVDFHSYHFEDHIKVLFPDEDGTLRLPVPNDRQMLDWPRPSPPTRSYTVRRYDGATLDLDFVVHAGGLAAPWAERLQVGDEVWIAGPPGAKAFPFTYVHYIFAVDPTGLPAAARWLEESPIEVSADLVIEFDHPAETAYPLAHRPAVDVQWVPRWELADRVQKLDVPDGTFLFAAGEADSIRPLRAWVKGRMDAVITGYWKQGQEDVEED